MGLLTPRRRLLSLLAAEIEAYLPQFEPYTSDYQMVVYACRDFEEWIRCKWATTGHQGVHEKLGEALEREPTTFRILLSFWVGRWLEKWRERVKLLSEKPKLPAEVLESIRKARRLYRGMEHRSELKRMVTRKLIREGEICLAEVIAENLVVNEIAKRIRGMEEGPEPIITPFEIFNSVSERISRLAEEKGPLIYLSIRPYLL